MRSSVRTMPRYPTVTASQPLGSRTMRAAGEGRVATWRAPRESPSSSMQPITV